MDPLMQVKDLRAHVDRRPFRPFRIFMSDGTDYTITDPNFVLVTRHTVHVGVLREGEDIPDETKYFDTIHITRIEPVATES